MSKPPESNPPARNWGFQPKNRPALVTYSVAVLATLAATLLRAWLTPLVGPTAVPYITYFPAVLFVAWYGGFRSALLCVVLSAFGGDYFFIAPVGSLSIAGGGDAIAILIFGLVGLGMALLAYSQREALRHAKDEAEYRKDAESAERELRQRLQTTLSSIGDAVLSTDARGHIVFANRIALGILRLTEVEVLGKHLDDIFRIVNEYTRAAVESPVAKVLREGAVVGLANHTVLMAPDGREIPIDDSAAPIRDADGALQGTVLVFRDVTDRRKAEEAGRLLASIIESSNDGIISKTIDGTVTSWNAGAERIFGYTASEMVGRPISVLCLEEANELPTILQRIKSGETIEHYETVRRSKSGALIHVSLTVSPVKDNLGRIVGASKIARDITERKNAEESLRQSEQKAREARDWLRTVLSSIGDAVIATDAQGRITFLNHVAATLTGWTVEEASGKRLDEVFVINSEETGATVESPVSKALREGRIVGLANHTRLTAKDGRHLPIDDSAAPIRDADGEITGVVLVFRDVSERKQAEAAIQESVERFRLMADHAPVLVWMAGTDKLCTWFNKPWLEFTGRSMEQEIGNGWAEGVHPEDFDRCLNVYETCFDQRKPFRMEYRLRRHDAAFRWVLDHGTPLYGPDGSFTGYIGSCIDISDRKKAEEALLRANEDLKQFAFAASHDLQEPLRMITSYSQLLVNGYRGQLDGEAEVCINFISRGTKRMRELLADLLAYTQVDARDQAPDELIDLNLIFQKAIENLKTAIDESEAAIDTDPLPVVHGQGAHFLQLFQNLLSNAIKYRAVGRRPKIHISASKNGADWQLSVSDNGIGIDPEYHERVFGVFKRLHGKSIPGTGIGLAICQRVVERSGGRIWVESMVDHGATFYFTVPITPGTAT